MTVAFCGDIMPGGVLPYQDEYISPEVKTILGGADFRVGTLECAIGDNLPFDEEKMGPKGYKNVVYARESDFSRVVEMGFNLVTLANNHIYDLGHAGLRNTIRLLKEHGIRYCGAGENIEEASAPCYVDIKGKEYAFIGCCFRGLPPWQVEVASEEKPGVYQTDIKEICQKIKNIKNTVEHVIILPHWGVEYDYMPPKDCLDIAKAMIDSGADAVIGSHTHILNPQIMYRGKPICFSLGNFLFPDFCLQVPRPIVYPKTKEEVYSLPVVLNYPRSIEHPVRVVWAKSSRTGAIAQVRLDEKDSDCKLRYIRLNSNNILEALSGKDVRKETWRMSVLSSLFKLGMFHFLRRAYYSHYNIFRKLTAKK